MGEVIRHSSSIKPSIRHVKKELLENYHIKMGTKRLLLYRYPGRNGKITTIPIVAHSKSPQLEKRHLERPTVQLRNRVQARAQESYSFCCMLPPTISVPPWSPPCTKVCTQRRVSLRNCRKIPAQPQIAAIPLRTSPFPQICLPDVYVAAPLQKGINILHYFLKNAGKGNNMGSAASFRLEIGHVSWL